MSGEEDLSSDSDSFNESDCSDSETLSSSGSSDHEEEEEGDEGVEGSAHNDDEEIAEDEVIVETIKRRRDESIGNIIIETEETIGAASFSPSDSVISIGCSEGNIYFYSFKNHQLSTDSSVEAHTSEIQCLDYTDDGCQLISGSSDKSIVITDIGAMSMANFFDDAMTGSITQVKVLDAHLFASGDDSGAVKIWDDRVKQKCVWANKSEIQDYISSITCKERDSRFVVTSGDGFVSQYDYRQYGLKKQSEQIPCDITCSSITHTNKLVCGTIKGHMIFYHWNNLFNCGDYRPIKKSSMNSMISVSDNIVISSWDDRTVRAHYLFPNREIGVVAQHDSPSMCLDVSHDGGFICSAPLSNSLKIIDIRYLEETDLNVKSKKRKNNFLPSSDFDNREEFFSEL